MRYIAVVCPKCGRASATKATAQRHQCPYCGTIIRVNDATVITVGDSKKVREAVVRYNTQKKV